MAMAVALCLLPGRLPAQTPAIQISGNTFPLTVLGQNSSQSVTLTVNSAYPDAVTITGVQTDPASSEYAVTSASGCTTAGSLAPGTSCSVTVQFTPALPGRSAAPVPLSHPGMLEVTYNDPTQETTGTVYVPLTGTGGGPHGVFAPGLISLMAGNDTSPTPGYSGDGGPATAAQFTNPQAMAIDGFGNIFIADTGNNAVRVIYQGGAVVANLIELENSGVTPVAGDIYTIAGNGTNSGGTDSVPATQSGLDAPQGVAVDAAGNVYIADTGNNAVRVIYMGDLAQAPLGTVLTNFYSGTFPTQGNIYTIAGTLNGANLDPNGYVCTNWANNGTTGAAPGNCWNGDQNPANYGQLWGPTGIAVDDFGDLLIADTQNGAIRAVYMGATPNLQLTPIQVLASEAGFAASVGDIYTVAGNPNLQPVSGNGDGSYAAGAQNGYASTATLTLPQAVTLDSGGDLYIADTGDNAVRFVNASYLGFISTVYSGSSPVSVAVDASDDPDFVLSGACQVMQYPIDGPPSTLPLAGSGACGPTGGVSGDSGAATTAELNNPTSLMVDRGGNLYILEAGAVRYVDGSQSPMAFGSQQILTSSAAQSALVMNLDINTPSMAGIGANYSGENLLTPYGSPYANVSGVAAPFAVVPYVNPAVDCANSYVSLYAGLSCGISITFTPTADGSFTGTALYNDTSYTASTGLLSAQQPIPLSGTGTGVAPTVSLTSSLNVGSVQVGASGTQDLTLTNLSSTTPVSIYSISFSPPFQAGTGGTCTVGTNSLPANGSCTIAVEFSPTVLGLQTSSVSVTDDASTGSGTQTATVSGTGTLSSAAVTLTSALNFGQQVVGIAGTAQNLVLTNQSATLAVYLYSIQFNQVSPSGAAFAFAETAATTCQFSLSGSAYLGPGQSCTVTMVFNPTNTTPQTGTVTITDSSSSATNGVDGQQTAQLTGTGVVPQAQVMSTGLPYGSVAAGTISAPAVITISNMGTGTLTFCSTQDAPGTNIPICFNSGTDAPIAPFTFSGNEADLFAVSTTTCGATLAVNASCTVSVVFSPPMTGIYSGTLNINDDSGGVGLRDNYATQTVALGGSSAVPVGTSSFTISNNVFPATQVGASTAQTVSLQLNAPLALKSIAIQTNFSEYSIAAITGCTVDGATVNPTGTVCQIAVTFTPAEAGNGNVPTSARMGPLVVTTTENGGTPYIFGMSGTANAPVAALTPGVIAIDVQGSGGVCDGAGGQDGLPANQALVGYLNGMALDSAGNMYLSDSLYNVIWRVDPAGSLHLFAGTPFSCGGYIQTLSGDGGPALGAYLSEGGPLAVDNAGGLYIGDSQNVGLSAGSPRIRYISPVNGYITSVVGNPGNGWPANARLYPGAVIQATVAVPNMPGPGSTNETYLFTVTQGGTTGGTQPVFPYTPGQTVNDGSVVWTNSGLGTTTGYGCPAQTDVYGDGCTGFNALLLNVDGIALDQQGDIFFSDWMPDGEIIINGVEHTDNHAVVREMNAQTGIVTIVAGNGTPGHSGDGGQGTLAEISPGDLALDSNGNLDIVDDGLWVRQLNLSTGVIETIAGDGVVPTFQQDTCYGDSGDGGSALGAGFGGITGIAFDAANNLYVNDYTACGVRRVDAGTQNITTIVGQGSVWGFNTGDLGSYEQANGYGSAEYASLKWPELVRLDGQGNVYIMELASGVRKINVADSVMDYNGIYFNNQQEVDTASAPLTTTVLNAGNSGQLAMASSFLSPPWGINSTNFTRDVTNPTGVSDCYDVVEVAPGYECPVNVDFTPLVSGALTGNDVVTDNSQNQAAASQTIGMYGTAVGSPPQVTLLPFLLSFSTPQGATSGAQNLTLTNTGSTPVTVNSIGITQTGTPFAQTNNCPSVLEGSAFCTIMVTFSPPVLPGGYNETFTGPDILDAQVVVTDTATNSPQTANLVGTGTEALASVTVTDNESFTVTDTEGASTPPWVVDNETFTLTDAERAMTPPLVVDNENFTVTDTEAAVSQSTGAGVSLSPASLTFGNQFNGAVSAAQNVTLTNSGGTALAITSIAASANFGESNNCGDSVAAGASCTIAVTFTPTVAGALSGTLSVTDSAGGSPQTATLTGTGSDLSLTVSNGSSSSSTVSPGETVTFTVVAMPVSGASGTVNFTCTGAPPGATCTPTPASISLSAAVTITVSVTTTGDLALVAPPPERPRPRQPPWIPAALLTLGGLLALMLRRRRLLATAVLAAAMLAAAGCSSSSSTTPQQSANANATPAGTYTLTLTATVGTVTRSTTLTLTVE